MKHSVRILAIGATLAGAAFAQPRQATIVGGGRSDRGKCTVEIVVDNVAQVEIRGTTATLRTLSGQPAQWRRFECTGAMPANPANFRFSGVDGRGRQELIREPRNGGAAVVQIEDKDGGAEGYTFDIVWESGGYPNRNQDRDRRSPDNPPAYSTPDRNRSDDQSQPNYRDGDYYRRYGHPLAPEEAIRACQQAVLAQAAQRFPTNDVHFNRTAMDDRPGRVTGVLDVHRGPREERFGFSCSLSFETGRVRSVDLDPRPLPDDDRRR
jgi:hypothetical protein